MRISKDGNIIAHDVSNIFGAGLLLAALAVLMFSLNIPLALTIFIALVLAFLIQFSAFGGKQGQKIWSDLNRSSTELDAAFSEYVAGMEEEKIFGRPETAARRLTGLVDKNREHWKVYLKRVTPISAHIRPSQSPCWRSFLFPAAHCCTCIPATMSL